jgi:glycosyltransferase involved in cell wall biosynthesis
MQMHVVIDRRSEAVQKGHGTESRASRARPVTVTGRAQVLIVGRIRDAAVERLCRDPRWRGRLHLAGFIPGAAGLARVLDVFAMPSRAEGLSRALLEAMCLGICPVVSDAGGG